MLSKTASYGLMLDFAVPAALDQTQQWVLSAMQSHGQELITMLWRILGNEQDVCDAYQDTFLRLAHYQGGQKPQHVKAYLFRSANNTAISILRRKITEKKNLSQTACTPRKAAWPPNELDARYMQETLRANIAQLPENFRNVITLHDLAELPYAQTAKILGITEATARVYRCKAVQLLAVRMNKNRDK